MQEIRDNYLLIVDTWHIIILDNYLLIVDTSEIL